MKLRTKFQDEYFNLEEVADVDIATMPDGRIKAQARAERGGLHTIFYKTKAEFDADWEDAPEEPKEYYTIDFDGEILPSDVEDHTIKKAKEIGNYFETKEEAEKAVERLRAWKRLKDKGISLTLDSFRSCVDYRFDLRTLKDEEIAELSKDLVICFGGEE